VSYLYIIKLFIIKINKLKIIKKYIIFIIKYIFNFTGRIYDDYDDEYDSDLDDFIDDRTEENQEDYSKHISEIFGYDKNKYKHIDDEDDIIMESNFAQQLKEEYESTKIGIYDIYIYINVLLYTRYDAYYYKYKRKEEKRPDI